MTFRIGLDYFHYSIVNKLCLLSVIICVSVSMDASSEQECKGMFSCADWNTVRVCAPEPHTGEFKVVADIQCPTFSPYCDNRTGSCGSFPADNLHVNKFICMKDGIFPDAYDCNMFHVCTNSVPYSYRCATKSYLFSTRSNTCEKRLSCSPVAFKCSGVNAYKIPFPSDSRYYVYCHNDKPLFVSKCEGDDTFDLHFQSCQPICVQEGKMVDSSNRSRFHLCRLLKNSIHGSSYSIATMDCPDGTVFNKWKDACVPTANVTYSKRESIKTDWSNINTILPTETPSTSSSTGAPTTAAPSTTSTIKSTINYIMSRSNTAESHF